MKYLIEIHHGIGDVVQVTGLVDTILLNDKTAEISLIINKYSYSDLFKYDNRIKNFYVIDLKNMSKIELLKETIIMRKERFDFLFVCPISNAKMAYFLAKLIGANMTIAEQINEIGEKIKKVDCANLHIVKKYEKLYLSSNLGKKIAIPRLIVDPILNPYSELKSYIVLCVGTSTAKKSWALYKYIEIAEHMHNKGLDIVILGGKKEEIELKQCQLPNYIRNYAGKLELLESARVCKDAELVIGGDTGVMHMAAAVGAKTLTLFSCTDPKLHCPYSKKSYYYNIKLECQYCYERGEDSLCHDFKCINYIETNDVLKLAEEILNSNVESKYYFRLED